MKNNYTIILLCLIAFSNSLKSQSPTWQWAKGTGTAANQDGMTSVTTDPYGNVYVTGKLVSSSITFGGITLNYTFTYSEDIFIVKYDSLGNVLWAKNTGSGHPYDIASDTIGNIYITGWFDSPAITFGSITLINSDQTNYTPDIFIVKYDSSGNALWAKSAGGLSSDIGWSVFADSNGNVFITGNFNSANIAFGSATLINNDPTMLTSDIFTVKYDANGNMIWAKKTGGNSGDGSAAICSDSNGNVYITGSYHENLIFANDTLSEFALGDFLLAKYDPSGNELWAKHGAGGFEAGGGVSCDANNNVFVTGNCISCMFDSITLNGSGLNSFILKYDGSGNIKWGKIVVTPQGNVSMCLDDNGMVLATGEFDSPNFIFGQDTCANVNSSSGDIFVVKYDNNGNEMWAKSAGGNNLDYPIAIASTGHRSIYIAGQYTSTNLTFGSTVLPSCAGCASSGSDKVFTAKLADVPTTIDIKENATNNNVAIYPNPFDSQTTIFFDKELKSATIKIIDEMGKEVKIITFSGNQFIIRKDQLKAGIYFIQVLSKYEVVTNKKIIITD